MDAKINQCLAAGGLSYKPGRVTVRHMLDVIHDDIGETAVRDKVVKPLTGLRVAPYYGCQVVRPIERRRQHRVPDEDGRAASRGWGPRWSTTRSRPTAAAAT